ncbi:dihydroorotase [Nitrosomonas sp. PY1]|uniref:dihydroorotase n=1 Tax=Nitrosomonas sp. PY1 TaxID=1803906 RepID=UPI001FC81DF3|nr:dihydroorotase [Nitrosomonas sp. PY1]GKS68409.1 dihydroorotase [Nitrosomonas sp. PY1]
MRIHIKNGRMIDPKQGIDTIQDIFIAKGKIIATGTAPSEFQANRIIDAQSLVVCPGLVDLSVRLREPGLEYKATLESEMAAAVAGGITSFACPPDTDPPLDEPGLVEMLKHRARNLNQAHVYPVGALTQGLKGERLTEMAELFDAGCVVFGQPNSLLSNLRILMQAMRYASTFDFSVWLRPQEISLTHHGVAHDGEVATRLGLPTIPVCSETIAISNIILLMKETGVKVHLCRISSIESLSMIRDAKQRGLPITCDVSINHLHLSDMDIGFFDSNCHLMPPLRSFSDRDALRHGLLDGTIDAVCSDHAPVDEDAKLLPFGQAEIGATGVELLLSLVLKWGLEMRLPLLKTLSKITHDSAQILGINAGNLSTGNAADICIFDPNDYWKVTSSSILSQGKNTPFLGMELPGKTRYTLVNGHIVYEKQN